MVPRTLEKKLKELAKQFPAIALLGPRQSGKTTLAKSLFVNHKYVNLESFEERSFAKEDPKGFLRQFEGGVILDEIQKATELLSYLQLAIDEDPVPGRFVLTGSQNILINQHLSQTLAGRVALTTLLPFSLEELRGGGKLPKSLESAIFQGFYPRVHQNRLDPVVFAESYIRTYVERDVRDIRNIVSLSAFQKFMRLCAGRIGQLLNMTSLAADAGLSLQTVKSWLSILEASYVLFLLQPYHNNFKKRLVKMPKLYFYDTALACSLLRLTDPQDVFNHYLRGNLFESMVIADLLKQRYHQALPPNLYFWRDKHGNEIDVIVEHGSHIEPIEIKSAETLNPSLFEGLKKGAHLFGIDAKECSLVYGGTQNQSREQGRVVSWKAL